MSEEQNPWLAGRTFLRAGGQVTRLPSAIPSPLEAIESARKQARVELRDRFAMAALTGVIASPVHERMPYAFDAARCAYEYADAMMKARSNICDND